jgi:hypothetical protein
MMGSLLPHIQLLQLHSKSHAMVLGTQEPLQLQVHLKSILLMNKAMASSKE